MVPCSSSRYYNYMYIYVGYGALQRFSLLHVHLHVCTVVDVLAIVPCSSSRYMYQRHFRRLATIAVYLPASGVKVANGLPCVRSGMAVY